MPASFQDSAVPTNEVKEERFKGRVGVKRTCAIDINASISLMLGTL